MISKRSDSQKWFLSSRAAPFANKKLFCFPYAGNGAAIFFHWPETISEEIHVCPVELPGRGRRFHEPLLYDLPFLISSLADAIVAQANKPFGFFGHSMGALISFELSKYLIRHYGISPEYLFVSACPAPQLYKTDIPVGQLSDSELLDRLLDLNGIPDEVLHSQEMLQIFLPIIRADLSLCDSFTYNDSLLLECPIVAFGGQHDPHVSQQDLEGWRNVTKGEFELHMMPGNHFFLSEQRKKLTLLLSKLYISRTDKASLEYG